MLKRPGSWQALGTWLALSIVLYFVWDSVPLYPFRMLAVFFHEMSHGMAALLTGGSVERLALDPAEGGHAITRGGWSFLIFSAGYLGNVLWGGALMVASAMFKRDRILSMLLGTILVGVTLVVVRSWFGFAFGMLSGTALIVMGWKGPELLNDLVLRFIGAFSCLYAIFDIKSDILDRPELRSDARMLSEVTMVPTMVWGSIWLAIAVVLFLGFLYVASAYDQSTKREKKSTPW